MAGGAFDRRPLAIAVSAALVTLGAIALRIAARDFGLYVSLWLAMATFAGSLALVRSAGLALIAAAIPFGTLHVASAALVVLGVRSAGHAVALAALIAGGIALAQVRALAAAVSDDAASSPGRMPGIAALAMFWLSVVLGLYPARAQEAAAVAATSGVASAALFAFVVLPSALRLVRLDEAAIARANRAAERFRNAAARLEIVAQPRWALSMTGIAIVLFTLAFFDRAGAHYAILSLWRTEPASALGIPLAVLVIGLAWLRSWRLALAATLAAAFAATLAAWMSFRIGLTLPLPPAIALTAGLVLFVAAGIAPDDDVGAGLAERYGTALCIALMASIACLPTAAALTPVTALIAALAVMPVFHVAIRAVWPRYRSVDEVFGRR